MKLKYHIIALDKEGEVFFEAHTGTEYPVSQLEYHLDRCMGSLFAGDIDKVIIERNTE